MTVHRLPQTISFKVSNRRSRDYPHSRVETARANGSQRARKAIQLAFVERRLGVIRVVWAMSAICPVGG